MTDELFTNNEAEQPQPTRQYPQYPYAQQTQQQPTVQMPAQPAQPPIGQPQPNTIPGAPLYNEQAHTTRAYVQRDANAFADPANAHGTQASVTAAGIAANAHTVDDIMKKNRATTIWAAAGSAVAAAVLVAGLGVAGIRTGVLTVPSSTNLSSMTSSTGGAGTTAVSGSSVDWTAIAKKVAPSVVSIQGRVSNGTVIGSGAVLDTEGHIITNNHVVNGASNLQVTLSNGNMYEADVVGTDPTTDLAVIKLKNAPSDLTPVTFANSDNLAVGESVMAIGSPLGYANTATTGIVSALNRPVSVASEDGSGNAVVTNAVQIDASINSGNSGGPTFNAEGKMIGINSSIATAGSSAGSTSGSSGSIGIGFAIPANLAKWVSSSIISSGKATHVVLGISVTTSTATADGVTRTGSQVRSVNSGSAGADAGLQTGDTIVAYNGHAVGSNEALLGYVRATQKGEKVTLTVVRDGKAVDLTVTMDHEETTTATARSNSGNGSNGNSGKGSNNGSDGSNGSDSDGSNGSGSNGFTNPFEQFFGGSSN
ncbi:hypothetical protein B9G54_07415 [Alloscardovia macacae]|uniref:PDZ domain-containing protein n=1 Tax=Alloscardovia macacae TaxID=1160091 RepID=A0A1Y2SUZ1_9BIFI|nr:trypsin-like peptidase domain-containing protein [Alloscardovia macacae]OTA25574.1 hypothetical protein B9G54_07415 [Alloscardovia macacae]OTA28150.1 hypothetical protein B9T39_07435 [Alloscardovia macacae]